MPINFYHLLIELARIHARSTPLERVFESLGDAVTESSKVIDRARGDKNDDYFQSVQDDESDVVESLVGAAFVAAQTHITAIVSVIKRLIARAKKDGQVLISSDGTKQGIMRLASATMGTSTFSRIEVVNTMANYFKHHDEWTRPWSNLAGQQKVTAEIVVASGGNEGSSGNLRTGLEALGIDSDILRQLHEEISGWAEAVVKTYEVELRAKGLL